MFRHLLAITVMLIPGLALGVDSKAPFSEGLSVSRNLFHSSMKEGVSCYRIPALATAKDGALLAVIDERFADGSDLGTNRDINLVMRRSEDNGDSWSAMETVCDYPDGQSASDPSLIVDESTGHIFLFYNFMDHDKAPGEYRLHLMKSTDAGKSWTEGEDITAQITREDWSKDFKFITSGLGAQTESGMLLHTLVNLRRGLHLFGSRDQGNSWFLIDTPIKPADESKVLELNDGRWLINSRVNKSGCRFTHISSDEGKTWESRREKHLIDPGCNGALLRYSRMSQGAAKNRILFSNARDKKKRQQLAVRISYDEGENWSKGKVVYPGRAAYSTMSLLNNGDIGLFFEIDDYQKNVFVRFSLDWLTDGEDPGEASE